ncbi:hypothetical protein LXM94_24060 [Rhizobium sp. TRM95111]|uniref:hypothetical protein n=1 Tax=Rhizobium alarense TaxID=2846851 RepID=UPI001F222ABF|nr:hypothetical protein [Rhizobium alarense]MCF3643040.1 hypothetical protein [Rhizobium alarense]
MSIGRLGALARFFVGFATRRQGMAPSLDIETLSDDRKRDLGLLDGRRPYREDGAR